MVNPFPPIDFPDPPPRKPQLARKARKVARVAGYVALGAAAVAQAVAALHPQLVGPLGTLQKIAELLASNLGF